MQSPNRPEQEKKNDRRVVELAPKLRAEQNLRAFGLQDLKEIPASMRRELYRRMNGHVPLSQQGWQSLKKQDVDGAEAAFQACLAEGADLTDERFFSVFWGQGEIWLHREEIMRALHCFGEALMRYPKRAREEHFLQCAELILGRGPEHETEAAAMALHGLVALQIDPADSSADRRLTSLYRSLELRRTNESRPPAIVDALEGRPRGKTENRAHRPTEEESFTA